MRSVIIAIGMILLTACNNNAPNQQAEVEGKSALSDSLFDAVMESHDVAMPKMFKLERLQKEAKAKSDSLNKLPAALKKENATTKAGLDSLVKDLEYADFAMNKWMQEFKYDSLKNNEPERIKYLQSEKVKVDKVKDAVLGSLQKAEALSIK